MIQFPEPSRLLCVEPHFVCLYSSATEEEMRQFSNLLAGTLPFTFGVIGTLGLGLSHAWNPSAEATELLGINLPLCGVCIVIGGLVTIGYFLTEYRTPPPV